MKGRERIMQSSGRVRIQRKPCPFPSELIHLSKAGFSTVL